MNTRVMITLLLTVLSIFTVYTTAFAETKQANDELIYQISGQKPGEVKVDASVADDATVDSAIALAEVATKFCVLIFFVSLLIQLVGKVIQHPGYTKWSRLLIGGTAIGFVTIRLAPIVLYGM